MSKLSDLILNANLTNAALARQADCSEAVIRKAIDGLPIRAVKARAIVNVLSQKLGRQISEQEAEIRIL